MCRSCDGKTASNEKTLQKLIRNFMHLTRAIILLQLSSLNPEHRTGHNLLVSNIYCVLRNNGTRGNS